MIDLLLEIGVSNLCLSLLLAAAAWTVQTRWRQPLIAHLLWLLVLAKLVTPPLFTIPVFEVPGLGIAGTPAGWEMEPLAELAHADATPMAIPLEGGERAGWASFRSSGKALLAFLWLLGSACVLIGSLLRIARFHRLLEVASAPADAQIRSVADEIAKRLGLNKTPQVSITTAHLSPMVWWVFGRVRVLIPEGLMRRMPTAELRWILAHELAHVRRRDHLVRWLEWLACVAFWWNPVAWFARNNLRVNEEICCDALVLESLEPDRRSYASSLLDAVEFLASSALRPPVLASEVISGGGLERRLRMIVSETRHLNTPRWASAAVLCAVGLLPLGVAHAQDPDRKKVEPVEATQVEKAQGGRRAAEGGQRFEKLGLNRERLARIQRAFLESGVPREKLESAVEGMIKLVHVTRKNGGEFAPRPGFRKHFAELGFTREQIERIEATAQRIAAGLKGVPGQRRSETGIDGHFARIGVQEETVAQIRWYLDGFGLEEAQVEPVIGAMPRVIHAIQTEGEDKELHPGLLEHFQKVGLDAEQIEQVQGLARQVAAGLDEPTPGETARRKGMTEKEYAAAAQKIEQAVTEGQLSEEDGRAKLEALRRKLAGNSGRSRGESHDMEEVRRKLELAVENGTLSREEANKKFQEIDQRVADIERRKAEHEAMVERVKAAIRAGEFTPEEGKEKLEEIEKKRSGER